MLNPLARWGLHMSVYVFVFVCVCVGVCVCEGGRKKELCQSTIGCYKDTDSF